MGVMLINELENTISQIKHYKPYLEKIIRDYNDIIIIGNGGSNSIASHISQDYTKVLNKKSYSFSDPSRLTCYINDYGRDEAYVEFLKDFADKDTLVILISSSGNSMNVFNCAVYCKGLGIPFIFQPDSNNRDEFYICRFDQDSLKVSQSAFKVYDVSLKIVEAW